MYTLVSQLEGRPRDRPYVRRCHVADDQMRLAAVVTPVTAAVGMTAVTNIHGLARI